MVCLAPSGNVRRPSPGRSSFRVTKVETPVMSSSTTRSKGRRLVLLGARSGGQGASRPPGSVWLVGAGPGDPDLLTVRALNVIRRADVLVHDGLVSEAIIDLAPAAARRISVAKRKSRH